MANEVTWNDTKGEISYEYWLMREAIVSALYDVLNMTNYVMRKSLAGVLSNAARFPKMPKLAASPLTEGTDLTTNTAFAPTQTTITVGEVGLKVTVTDLAEMGGLLGLVDYGAECGKAVAEKITGDLVALGAGFSNSVGTTNTDLTHAFMLSAAANLRARNVPGPYVAVLHPNSWPELLANTGSSVVAPIGSTGSSLRSESMDLPASGRDGVHGPYIGFDQVLSSTQVGEDGNSDKENFAYSPSRALGYVERWAIRVEMERDASLRGTEVVVTAAVGVGEIDDASGVRIISDGA